MKFSTTKAVIRYNLYLGTFKNDKKVLPKCKQKPEALVHVLAVSSLRYSVKSITHLSNSKGAFTQSVLRGVICRRLGYLKNKKCFFSKKTTILRGVFCPSVNAT